MDSFFWTESRRETLRIGLKNTMEALGLSTSEIAEMVSMNLAGREVPISQRSISRLLSGEVRTRHSLLSQLLTGVVTELNRSSGYSQLDLEHAEGLFSLFSELSGKPPVTDIHTPSSPDARWSTVSVSEVIRDVSAFLQIPTDGAMLIEKLFFKKADTETSSFFTYYFAATPGYVQKSLLVLHRPSADIPIVRFNTFFNHEGRIRGSSGIALKFGREVVFWGQVDAGLSSETIVFENLVEAQDRYFGLQITNDPEYGTVAARTLLKRTDVTYHSDAMTGRISVEQAQSELGDDGIDRVRNEIPFSLEQDVISSDGVVLSQSELVGLVGSALRFGRDPAGHPSRLRFEDGREFNPADSVHYTFNSSLRIRR